LYSWTILYRQLWLAFDGCLKSDFPSRGFASLRASLHPVFNARPERHILLSLFPMTASTGVGLHQSFEMEKL
jgi:hypothetical protein